MSSKRPRKLFKDLRQDLEYRMRVVPAKKQQHLLDIRVEEELKELDDDDRNREQEAQDDSLRSTDDLRDKESPDSNENLED